MSRSIVCFLSVLFLIGSLLPAQCATQWAPGDVPPGVNGSVYDVLPWDPDGAGPVAELIVATGTFTTAGGVAVAGIAAFDPTTKRWSALGSGLGMLSPGNSCFGLCLATLSNGNLVVGGLFDLAGGVLVSNIAQWDGVAWSSLGTGVSGGTVVAMQRLGSGQLVVGGHFTQAGTTPVSRIASWDGSVWAALGTGISGGAHPSVNSMAVMPNGDLVVGGLFSLAGSSPANCIARWDGIAWTAIPATFTGYVFSLAVLASGDVLAGGAGLMKWDGSSWSALLSGGNVYDVLVMPNGSIIATWLSPTQPPYSHRVLRWDGSVWTAMGADFNLSILALSSLSNGDVVVGGQFTSLAATPALLPHVARWNGSDWHPLEPSTNDLVHTLTTMPNGDVVVGGNFTYAGGMSASRIARWDGSDWRPMGTGMSNNVYGLATTPNGDVIAVGDFVTAGGVTVNQAARWDGLAWSALGGGFDSSVLGVTALANGAVVAGGAFTTADGQPASRIARWDGSSWSALGGGVDDVVHAVVELPSGGLIVGGNFTTAGGVAASRIARWDGSAWSSLGDMSNNVYALAVLPNGDVVAAGDFLLAGGVPADRIARWDGTNWFPLGAGLDSTVNALHVLPNGDLLAGGYFTNAGGAPANHVARWDGTGWSAVDGGMANWVAAFALTPNGEVWVGGGLQAPFLARLVTTCPATTSVLGVACPSSGGSNTLLAETPPWLGSAFRLRGTGLPVPSFVLQVTGFGTLSFPLGLLLPEGQPGCDLQVSPDLLDIAVCLGGVVTSQLDLPNTPALAGAQLYHQLLPFEVDASLAFVAITATNAIAATLGAF